MTVLLPWRRETLSGEQDITGGSGSSLIHYDTMSRFQSGKAKTRTRSSMEISADGASGGNGSLSPFSCRESWMTTPESGSSIGSSMSKSNLNMGVVVFFPGKLVD